MNCRYFGICGSCTLFDMSYEEQLEFKIKEQKARFENFTNIKFDIIKSAKQNFRNRAEFRVVFDKENKKISYAMYDFQKNLIPISNCSIVSLKISQTMPKLIVMLNSNDTLSFKLFSIEFLSSTNDLLVTLIYHKKLDEIWEQKAKEIEKALDIKLIGRSKKQKIVLSSDFICQTLNILNQEFKFIYKENSFTQPNTAVNIQMIEWVLKNTQKSNKDLCELYCGSGNFTIPISQKFNKVLATEISKTAIKSALKNSDLNNTQNTTFVRISALEFTQALENKRAFNRLKNIDLKSYDFSTIFLDPPRSGLDDTTRNLAKNFENIIYISCNPQTLYKDLQTLIQTHNIVKFAFFDQFVYTKHTECGVILKKVSTLYII